MRRLFADRLVIATGVIVVLMSALFALLRGGRIGERGRGDGLRCATGNGRCVDRHNPSSRGLRRARFHEREALG